MFKFFIHILELKLWHFEEFPYVCIGKSFSYQCFMPTRYVRGGSRGGCAHVTMTIHMVTCAIYNIWEDELNLIQHSTASTLGQFPGSIVVRRDQITLQPRSTRAK